MAMESSCVKRGVKEGLTQDCDCNCSVGVRKAKGANEDSETERGADEATWQSPLNVQTRAKFPFVICTTRISECITLLNQSEPLKSILGLLRLVMHLGECIMGNTDTYAFLLSRRVFLFLILYCTKCITYYVALSSTLSKKSRGDFTVGLGSIKSISTHEVIIGSLPLVF